VASLVIACASWGAWIVLREGRRVGFVVLLVIACASRKAVLWLFLEWVWKENFLALALALALVSSVGIFEVWPLLVWCVGMGGNDQVFFWFGCGR